MEKIEIDIAADGSLSYKVSGVKGSGCKSLTAAIDNLSRVIETKKTSEFCELPNVAAQQQHVKGA